MTLWAAGGQCARRPRRAGRPSRGAFCSTVARRRQQSPSCRAGSPASWRARSSRWRAGIRLEPTEDRTRAPAVRVRRRGRPAVGRPRAFPSVPRGAPRLSRVLRSAHGPLQAPGAVAARGSRAWASLGSRAWSAPGAAPASLQVAALASPLQRSLCCPPLACSGVFLTRDRALIRSAFPGQDAPPVQASRPAARRRLKVTHLQLECCKSDSFHHVCKVYCCGVDSSLLQQVDRPSLGRKERIKNRPP